MKKLMMLFMIGMLAYNSQAQDNRTLTSISFQVNNSYQFTSSKSTVNNFYGLGGVVNLYFKDKFYLGFSQLGSVSPSDLSKNNSQYPNKIKLNEYALNLGLKTDLNSNIYLITGVRGGIALTSMGVTQKIDGFNEFVSKESTTSYLVAPEVKIGFQLNNYFAIEAGTTYKKYIGQNEQWGIAPKDFDGFGATLALIGRIPFN